MNILDLGLDVSSFNEEKKVRLNEYISIFDKLAKYDGKKINVSLGDGFTTLNSSVLETNKLLSEMDAKITSLQSKKVVSTDNKNQVTQLTLSVAEYKKITDETEKTVAKLAAATSDEARNLAVLKMQLSETTKGLLDYAKGQSQVEKQKSIDTVRSAEYRSEQKRVVEALRQVAIEQDKAEKAEKAYAKSIDDSKIRSAEYRAEQKRVVESLRSLAIEQDKAEKSAKKNVTKDLISDHEKLVTTLKRQEEAYRQLYITKGKNDPATKYALAEYSTTAKVITDIDKRLQDAHGSNILFTGGLRNMFSQLRILAYILPGLGIAGIFNLAFEAVGNLVSSLGIFDNELEKSLDKQLEFNKSQKELLELIEQIDDAYRSNLGQKQYLDNLSKYASASGQSELTNLVAKRNSIYQNSFEAADRAGFTNTSYNGGFTELERLRKEMESKSFDYKQIRKDIDDGLYKNTFTNGNGIGTESEGKKLLEVAKQGSEFATESYNKQKKIMEENAILIADLHAADLRIAEYIAEQKRKLTLETSKFEANSVIDKNKIILDKEISSQRERQQALKSIKDAEDKISKAEKNYVLSQPSSRNEDGSLTTEAKVAMRKASEEIAENDREYKKRLADLNESYRQRMLAAETSILKDFVEVNAIQNEKIYKNENASLNSRLMSYAIYIADKQKLQELEFNKDKEKLALKANDPTAKKELEALKSARDMQIKNIQADAEAQIYNIAYTALRKELKDVIDLNKLTENEYVRHYAQSLALLNKSFEEHKISYNQYKGERERLDKEFSDKVLSGDIKNDEENILRLQKEIDKLLQIKREADEELDLNKAQLDDKKRNNEGYIQEELTYNSQKGKTNAINQALIDAQKEMQKAMEKMDNDELKRAKAKYDTLIRYQKEFADNNKQIINELFALAKQAIDAEYDERLRTFMQRQELNNAIRNSEVESIERSSLDAKNKSALEIQLNEQKKESDRDAKIEERKIKREQAVADRALAVTQILINTEIGASEAIATIPPPFGELIALQRRVLGGIAIAKVLTAPIPYAKGTPAEGHPGGRAKYGEDGKEIVVEPGKAPYIVSKETISELPKGTHVIPIENNPNFEVKSEKRDDSWSQTMFLAKQIKKYSKNGPISNTIIIDMGFNNYKDKTLYGK